MFHLYLFEYVEEERLLTEGERLRKPLLLMRLMSSVFRNSPVSTALAVRLRLQDRDRFSTVLGSKEDLVGK